MGYGSSSLCTEKKKEYQQIYNQADAYSIPEMIEKFKEFNIKVFFTKVKTGFLTFSQQNSNSVYWNCKSKNGVGDWKRSGSGLGL